METVIDYSSMRMVDGVPTCDLAKEDDRKHHYFKAEYDEATKKWDYRCLIAKGPVSNEEIQLSPLACKGSFTKCANFAVNTFDENLNDPNFSGKIRFNDLYHNRDSEKFMMLSKGWKGNPAYKNKFAVPTYVIKTYAPIFGRRQ